MKHLPHGVLDVFMTMLQPNNVPFSRSLVARARYSSRSASSADFEEEGVASSDKRSRPWRVSVESASIPGRAMKSSSRAAVMRPRIAIIYDTQARWRGEWGYKGIAAWRLTPAIVGRVCHPFLRRTREVAINVSWEKK